MVCISNFSFPETANKGMRRQLSIVICGMTALILLSACGKDAPTGGGPGGAGMSAMPVTVIEAKLQRVPVTVEAVGQTEASKDVQVRARVSGILQQQLYTEGDKVKSGSVLFTIDRAPFEIALAQARASLAQDEANLEKTKREAARLRPLVEQKAVSQRELDDANTSLQTAQAMRMSSDARVRDAELNLSYTDVAAPISGITDRAQYSLGTLITPGAESSLLTTIHAIDPIWVRFSFSDNETQQMRKAGGKSKVTLLSPDGSVTDISGKLNFTASTVDTRTGMVPLRAELPNPKHALLPGQFVRVQVTLGVREAYLVPQAALTQTDQGKLVYIVSADNTVTPRPVETDGWSGNEWVVTKGLAQGDKVIIDNLMKLRPGAPVMPHEIGRAHV